MVTNVTADGRGSRSASPTFGGGSLSVRANLRARGHGERTARFSRCSRDCLSASERGRDPGGPIKLNAIVPKHANPEPLPRRAVTAETCRALEGDGHACRRSTMSLRQMRSTGSLSRSTSAHLADPKLNWRTFMLSGLPVHLRGVVATIHRHLCRGRRDVGVVLPAVEADGWPVVVALAVGQRAKEGEGRRRSGSIRSIAMKSTTAVEIELSADFDVITCS